MGCRNVGDYIREHVNDDVGVPVEEFSIILHEEAKGGARQEAIPGRQRFPMKFKKPSRRTTN